MMECLADKIKEKSKILRFDLHIAINIMAQEIILITIEAKQLKIMNRIILSNIHLIC